ncbi:MAG: hypothetical protein QXU75_06105, partial [Candidatus Methanomethylicaceae archaeon]
LQPTAPLAALAPRAAYAPAVRHKGGGLRMKEPREVTLMGDAESDGRWIRVFGWGPGLGNEIWSGYYKLVYGTPRKLWDPREPEKPLFEAYEIEGEFDAESITWRQAKMKVKVEATGDEG